MPIAHYLAILPLKKKKQLKNALAKHEHMYYLPLNADSFSIQALPLVCYVEDKVFQDCADLGLNQE